MTRTPRLTTIRITATITLPPYDPNAFGTTAEAETRAEAIMHTIRQIASDKGCTADVVAAKASVRG